MLLQYFKKKENQYKKIADNIYINILKKSKKLINDNYFININFDSSFELTSILLIAHLKIHKEIKIKKYNKINDEIVKNFISDLDNSMPYLLLLLLFFLSQKPH